MRTSRWPFAVLSLVLLPAPLLFLVALTSADRLAPMASIGLTFVTGIVAALWLSAFFPCIRPRELIFSTQGLRFKGLLVNRYWEWSQFNHASGGSKVTLHFRASGAKRIFIGPFWPGGSARVDELARAWNAVGSR